MLSLTQAQETFASLRAKHSFRNDHSDALRNLWDLVLEARKSAESNEQLPWMWLEYDILTLLELRQKQWDLLDEVVAFDPKLKEKIVLRRIGLLLSWFGTPAPDTPALTRTEFRERASTIANGLDGLKQSSPCRRMLYQADLPDHLNEFQGTHYPDEVKTLWDLCTETNLRQRQTVIQATAVSAAVRELLSNHTQYPVSLLYALVGSIRCYGRLGALAALATEPTSLAPERVPQPADLLQRMAESFTAGQLAVSAEYIISRYFLETFCLPYLSDEPLKEQLLNIRYQQLLEEKVIKPNVLIMLLKFCSSRFTFWSSAEDRESWVEKIETLARRHQVDGLEWNKLLGMLAWVAGNESKANASFIAASAYVVSGASVSRDAVGTFFPHEQLTISDAAFEPYAAESVQGDLSSIADLDADPALGLLATVADSKYFLRYGGRYLESLRNRDPDVPILFHVVDLNDEARAMFKSLAGKHPRVYLTSERAVLARPFYYALVRLLRAHDIVAASKRAVFFTDIDCSFRADTKAAFSYARDFDLLLRIYDRPRLILSLLATVLARFPKVEPWCRVNAAAFLLNSTEEGLNVASLLRNLTAAFLHKFTGQNSTNWWMDQNILYQFERLLYNNSSVKLGNFENTIIPYSTFRHMHLSAPDKLAAWRAECGFEKRAR